MHTGVYACAWMYVCACVQICVGGWVGVHVSVCMYACRCARLFSQQQLLVICYAFVTNK